MTNQETVDTVYLQGRKFIPYEKIFLEVVVKDKISLLLQNRSTLQAPGVQVGYGGTSELTSSKYMSGVQMSTGYYNLELPEGYLVKPALAYWVKVDDKLENFFNERQFLKIFPELEERLKLFIKQNKIKTDRIEDLVKLVQYCNELEK